MSENNFQPSFWLKVIIFIKNHSIDIIIAIAITSFFFYFVERKEIEPRYAVSNIELIAEQTFDAPELKLFWDGQEIQEVQSIKIAIWNSGKQYISEENISDNKPIMVNIPSGIQILYAEFIETSRPTLQFSTKFLPSEIDRQTIRITIVGDDAIEKDDGGVIKILFTGTPQDDFAVTGRIFGSKEGLKKSNWPSRPISELNLPYIILLISAVIIFFSSFHSRISEHSADEFVRVFAVILFLWSSMWLIIIKILFGPPWIYPQ